MIHEKILKRPDGMQYKIEVVFTSNQYRKEFNYHTQVQYRERGKKKWFFIRETLSSYEYRKLSFEDQEKYRLENMLRFVTTDEINTAKLELWEKLKPKLQ